jgi:Na+-transporting methylmalonyl-CoA/oxaloacetate decarboxylase gamma subunit
VAVIAALMLFAAGVDGVVLLVLVVLVLLATLVLEHLRIEGPTTEEPEQPATV